MDINCFLSRNIHMGAIKHSELVEFGRICCEGILQLFIVYISILGNNNISNDLWNCCNPLGVILDCSIEQQSVKRTKIKAHQFHIHCVFVYFLNLERDQYNILSNKQFIFIMELVKRYRHPNGQQLNISKR